MSRPVFPRRFRAPIKALLLQGYWSRIPAQARLEARLEAPEGLARPELEDCQPTRQIPLDQPFLTLGTSTANSCDTPTKAAGAKAPACPHAMGQMITRHCHSEYDCGKVSRLSGRPLGLADLSKNPESRRNASFVDRFKGFRVRYELGSGHFDYGTPTDMTDTIAVLVVEDEPLVRLDIADHLTDEGFEVFEARNADDAIAILEREQRIRICSRTSTCRVRWTASNYRWR